MALWNNPAVDRAAPGNDFSFDDLRKRPKSIYVVVNADDIRMLSPLVWLFFGELIATMRSTLPGPKVEPRSREPTLAAEVVAGERCQIWRAQALKIAFLPVTNGQRQSDRRSTMWRP